MNGTVAAHGVAVNRGRVDKRTAILEAALDVFAEVGYAAANVDTIAARAGVAKPTVYNHFGDKEALFRSVIVEFSRTVSEANMQAVEALPIAPVDLRADLIALGTRLNGCFHDVRARNIYRLMVAEIIHFPDLFEEWQRTGPTRLQETLGGRFALLIGNGYLEAGDAMCCASQFIGLVSDSMITLSAFGTRPIETATYEGVIETGVDTFIRAFGTGKGLPQPSRTCPATPGSQRR
jgi:TetR/AcrR family transcriptional repressor of mexJK operon